MAKATTYDPKSLRLAQHFLADESTPTREQWDQRADSLARTIQTAVEDWFDDNPPNPIQTAAVNAKLR